MCINFPLMSLILAILPWKYSSLCELGTGWHGILKIAVGEGITYLYCLC